MIIRGIIFFILFWVLHFLCHAQSQDSVVSETPFRKGRWIVDLNGMINSGSVIIPDSANSDKKFSSNYSFIINGYRLIKDKLAIGLQLSVSRSSSEEFIIQESEVFNLGPGFRYFLSNQKNGGAYLQPTIFYTRFYDRTAFLDVQDPIDRVLKGSGVGISLGLGYSYVFKDILILEVGFDYSYAWLSGKNIDQINNVTIDTKFRKSSFSFSYGIGILIGKRK